jgi:hypothetical protein
MGSTKCGDGKLYFDRERNLKSDLDCGRKLKLKCNKDEQKFAEVSYVWLKVIVQAAAGSKVENVKRLKDGCLSIKTKTLKQAVQLRKLVNIAGLFPITVEEDEDTKTVNNYLRKEEEQKLPFETSKLQTWRPKMNQSRPTTTCAVKRPKHHCKETSGSRWQNHRYKTIEFDLNFFRLTK